MNALVQPLGLAYDANGELASSGQMISEELLDQFNQLDFYKKNFPQVFRS